MENLGAILAAAALFALFALLAWMVARGWQRMLRNDPALAGAVKSCVSCALRPVCDAGCAVQCPNVARLRR
jgi:radical SAM protein with 4Fe4S-binding SPASM domain